MIARRDFKSADIERMASSRLSDDTCTYRRAVKQSVDPLSYQLEPAKYIHDRRCMMQLGIVGGNTVSTVSGEALVDTESELKNITRRASKCPSKKFSPSRDGPGSQRDHLQSCQIINYKSVPGATWTPPTPPSSLKNDLSGVKR